MGLRSSLNVIKLYPNTSKSPAINVLQKHFPSVHVLVICDREFSQEPSKDLCKKEADRLGVKPEQIYFWDLPCIESYLVAHHFKHVDSTILDWLKLDRT